MKKKKLILVTDHSTWWKKKKYRKNSSEQLKKSRSAGWCLLKKIRIINESNSIETRSFHKYILIKR